MRANSAVASSVAPFGELEDAREVFHVREATSFANGYPAREREREKREKRMRVGEFLVKIIAKVNAPSEGKCMSYADS